MSKFRMTDNKKEAFGRTVFQIAAGEDIGSVVKKDELGGWLEKPDNLVMFGGAWVTGEAVVYGEAQVAGDAWISGEAQISGNVMVSGNAQVYGNVWISGEAKILDNAQVYGNAWISGEAWVSGNARVSDNAKISGNAQVSGEAQIFGDAVIEGEAQVFGDAQVAGKLRLQSGQFFGVLLPGESIQEIPLSNGAKLMARGEVKYESGQPLDTEVTEAMDLLRESGFKITKDTP